MTHTPQEILSTHLLLGFLADPYRAGVIQVPHLEATALHSWLRKLRGQWREEGRDLRLVIIADAHLDVEERVLNIINKAIRMTGFELVGIMGAQAQTWSTMLDIPVLSDNPEFHPLSEAVFQRNACVARRNDKSLEVQALTKQFEDANLSNTTAGAIALAMLENKAAGDDLFGSVHVNSSDLSDLVDLAKTLPQAQSDTHDSVAETIVGDETEEVSDNTPVEPTTDSEPVAMDQGLDVPHGSNTTQDIAQDNVLEVDLVAAETAQDVDGPTAETEQGETLTSDSEPDYESFWVVKPQQPLLSDQESDEGEDGQTTVVGQHDDEYSVGQRGSEIPAAEVAVFETQAPTGADLPEDTTQAFAEVVQTQPAPPPSFELIVQNSNTDLLDGEEDHEDQEIERVVDERQEQLVYTFPVKKDTTLAEPAVMENSSENETAASEPAGQDAWAVEHEVIERVAHEEMETAAEADTLEPEIAQAGLSDNEGVEQQAVCSTEQPGQEDTTVGATELGSSFDAVQAQDVIASLTRNNHTPSWHTPAVKDQRKPKPVALDLEVVPTVQVPGSEAFVPPKRISGIVRTGTIIEHAGDIIIEGSVHDGAEIRAGGDIHIYGMAGGRLFAGCNGNKGACLYINSFDAEIVSIDGRARVFEEIPNNWKSASMKISLDAKNRILRFSSLSREKTNLPRALFSEAN